MLTFVGCLIDGYLMDKFGRKSLLYSAFAIHAIGWMIIAETEYFITGRILVSLAMGMWSVSFAYKFCCGDREDTFLEIPAPEQSLLILGPRHGIFCRSIFSFYIVF